ncbi:hypothetical protein AQUCO_00400185v1 [Aquilegia coerulea]|uniref:Uncharacterized protein n=1 Tax=Aquilegia coerulea TaxID=218851 RepID=A0A2G5EU24_AQUCA|nr:hypothetical protein AQUCO_00400185v1 [Aquilegia coerulea]
MENTVLPKASAQNTEKESWDDESSQKRRHAKRGKMRSAKIGGMVSMRSNIHTVQMTRKHKSKRTNTKLLVVSSVALSTFHCISLGFLKSFCIF